MGEQEEGKDHQGDRRGGESRGVGGALRKKEEASTKARALEREADDHHDGLEPAIANPVYEFRFVFSLFVCFFDIIRI